MRPTKLQKGSWVQRHDGAKGSIQSYGYCYDPVSRRFREASRAESLRREEPAVKVVVVKVSEDALQWWTFDTFDPIPAPSFRRVR